MAQWPAQRDFPAEMRDRQARGKDPYARSDEELSASESDEGADRGQRKRLGQGFSSESFQDREKRAFALSVLDSREQLLMYAQSTNDSVPGQRRRFMAMLCGYEADLKPKPRRR